MDSFKTANPDPALALPNPRAEAAMQRHRAIIEKTTVDAGYAYDPEQLIAQKIDSMAASCERVLDVGQSSRGHATRFNPGQLVTVNVSRGESPPDIIDDICDPSRLQPDSYDGIVCLSVLEHVYDPFAAIANLHELLRPGGRLLLHLPFMFRYHAPADLAFTDSYRFSRDGLAWLLKDFSDVTLYPVRGPYSSLLNLLKFWKKHIEKRFGMAPGRVIDQLGLRMFRRPTSDLTVSGYYAWAVK